MFISLSLRFSSHFPGEPGLAGVYRSKGWWRRWWQLNYSSYKLCKAPVKSSPPTNQHPVFYSPDALPVAQPTVSKHWWESCNHRLSCEIRIFEVCPSLTASLGTFIASAPSSPRYVRALSRIWQCYYAVRLSLGFTTSVMQHHAHHAERLWEIWPPRAGIQSKQLHLSSNFFTTSWAHQSSFLRSKRRCEAATVLAWVGAVKYSWWGMKKCVFRPISRHISQIIQDRATNRNSYVAIHTQSISMTLTDLYSSDLLTPPRGVNKSHRDTPPHTPPHSSPSAPRSSPSRSLFGAFGVSTPDSRLVLLNRAHTVELVIGQHLEKWIPG